MGNPRAGDCGRLTFCRGHGAASHSPTSHLPIAFSTFGENRDAR
jgi:hypothetical protein